MQASVCVCVMQRKVYAIRQKISAISSLNVGVNTSSKHYCRLLQPLVTVYTVAVSQTINYTILQAGLRFKR